MTEQKLQEIIFDLTEDTQLTELILGYVSDYTKQRESALVERLREKKKYCSYDENYNCTNEPYDCDANLNFNQGIKEAIELIEEKELSDIDVPKPLTKEAIAKATRLAEEIKATEECKHEKYIGGVCVRCDYVAFSENESKPTEEGLRLCNECMKMVNPGHRHKPTEEEHSYITANGFGEDDEEETK